MSTLRFGESNAQEMFGITTDQMHPGIPYPYVVTRASASDLNQALAQATLLVDATEGLELDEIEVLPPTVVSQDGYRPQTLLAGVVWVKRTPDTTNQFADTLRRIALEDQR